MARRTYVLPSSLDGVRLDQALAALAPGLSRRSARELIAQGAVYVGGRRCRVVSRPVGAGAAIAVEEPGRFPVGGDIRVTVLWRGDGMVALDKPAGVPLVPTKSSVVGTVLHALAHELGRPLATLFPVHRLDTPTSGVALVASDRSAAGRFSEALREGRVRKNYLAWVMGRPVESEGEWTWPLSEARAGLVRVEAAGRPATTRYEVLESRPGRTLLELWPETGRTHQLRVHCATAGYPILGDRKYGGPAASLALRALLHARRIAFPLSSGREQTVEAPLPPDMA